MNARTEAHAVADTIPLYQIVKEGAGGWLDRSALLQGLALLAIADELHARNIAADAAGEPHCSHDGEQSTESHDVCVNCGECQG